MTDVFYCGIIDGNMSVGGNNKDLCINYSVGCGKIV